MRGDDGRWARGGVWRGMDDQVALEEGEELRRLLAGGN